MSTVPVLMGRTWRQFFRTREVQHKRRNATVFKRCYALCASEANWGILVLTVSRSLLLTHPMVQVNKTYPAHFCFGLNIPRSIRIAELALKKAFLPGFPVQNLIFFGSSTELTIIWNSGRESGTPSKSVLILASHLQTPRRWSRRWPRDHSWLPRSNWNAV